MRIKGILLSIAANAGTLALICAMMGGSAQNLTASPLPGTCVGNCGTDGIDGVINSLSPIGSTQYQYVSTFNGVAGAGIVPGAALPVDTQSGVGETNGSVLAMTTFNANAGDTLNYYFDYVTTDGAQFNDYAWAGLYDASTDSIVAMLFTARTEPTGATVPGLGLPAVDATVNNGIPVDIQTANNGVLGGPVWSPLGTRSGQCFDLGCGYTGWVNSTYVIQNSGTYYIVAGAANWIDQDYDSGLAIDGQLISGTTNGSVPEPSTWAITGAFLVALICLKQRKLFGKC